MRIFLILLYREVYLIPLVGFRQISGQIRGDIFPFGIYLVLLTLYGEEEVRTGLITRLVIGITHEGGEVEFLSLT